MQSLWTGLSALNSASDWLSRISNNLANLNTVGYAQTDGSFADAFTRSLQGSATAPEVAGRTTPLGWWGGSGVLSVGTGIDFSQLPIQNTGNPTDVAIQGPAFFEVGGPTGKLLTKAGNFTWSATPTGKFELALPNGMPVLDTTGKPIVQPSKPTTMTIGRDGQITFGTTPGPKLALVDVTNPSSSLVAQSDNTFSVKPGEQVRAATDSTVQQGALAMSNVNMTGEMTDMIQAQQMFNLNSESVQLTNKMASIADSIK